MHKSFADWYRTASLGPTKEELESRFAAVAAAAAAVKKPRDAIDLVEVVYGLRKPVAEVSWFVDEMKTADTTLRLEDNENTLAVLAGCTLAFLMSTEGSDWSNIGTALRCASYRGTRLPVVMPNLLHLADETVTRWQRMNRQEFDAQHPTVYGVAEKTLAEAYAALEANPDGTRILAAVKAVAQQTTNALVANSKSLKEALEQTQAQVALHREEIDMLWWVLGGWVFGLDAPLSTVPVIAAPLVIGWELGGLVRVFPEPHALPAIVERSLHQVPGANDAEVTLAAAVEAMPPRLLASWGLACETRFEKIAPLTIALNRAAEDPTGWRAGFERTTGVRADTPLTAHRLAMQACAERILPKQFSQ